MGTENEKTWRGVLVDAALKLQPPGFQGKYFHEAFANCCEDLIKEGAVVDWQETKKGSPDDINGTDFWIDVELEGRTLRLPFGVTSTEGEAKKRRRKHPDVFHIAMRYRETGEIKEPWKTRRMIKKGIRWHLDRWTDGEKGSASR